MGASYLYLSIFCASFGAFLAATVTGWSSPMVEKLQEIDDNPLGRKITKNEISWLASLAILGSCTGCLVISVIGSKFGRKTLLLANGCVVMIFYLMMAWSKTIWLLYLDYHEYKKQPGHPAASSLQVKKPKAEELKSSSSTKAFKTKSQSFTGSKPSIAGSTVESLREPSASSLTNKEVLINPDCYLGSILDYICEVVGLPKNLYFTMCSATSDLMAVGDSPLSTPGLDIFAPKETYYIILKDYDNTGNEISFPLLRKNTELYAYFMSKLRNELVEHPTKQSIASTVSSKLKSKDVKVKNRVKSANPQKEGKGQGINLPYTKQRSSIASPSAKQRNSTTLPPIKQRNSTALPPIKQR